MTKYRSVLYCDRTAYPLCVCPPIPYTVTYDGNTNTSGNAPVDSSSYTSGTSVTVLGNTGSPALAKTGYAFAGWNTMADGSGTSYAPASTFPIDGHTTLFAQWTLITYTVTYDGNTNTSGNAPVDSSSYTIGTSVTVLGNTGSPALAKTGYTFAGWNSMADGSGTTYAPASTFLINGNTTLFAQWILNTTTTILAYNTSQGSSVEWEGNTFTRNTNLPDFSYTATITAIPASQVPSAANLIGVTVGNIVTSIGTSAFQESGVTTVTFAPTSILSSIGDTAFYLCTALTSITIPDSVTSIGTSAFQESGVTTVTFSPTSTRQSIGNYVFYLCIGLTSVTIPDSVTSIGEGVFYLCTALTSITIPDSVTSIGTSAFRGCGLTSITFSPTSTLQSIGDTAFRDCTALTSITIPTLVTSIGTDAFYNCRGLTSITFASTSTLITIGTYAFVDCLLLSSITIPTSVTSIGEGVFYNCRGLTSITIPNSVTSIGVYAFYSCRGTTSVTFAPTSILETIGGNAFDNCEALTSIIIPTSVTSIGTDAFLNSGLTLVTIANFQLVGIPSPASGVSFFGRTVTTQTP
jgi:uncharacterized repeat protein (TIGR02543 family)